MAMYAMVDGDGWYVGRISTDADPEGPYTYHIVTETPALSDPNSATRRLAWNGGSPAWVETATLDELKATKTAEINDSHAQANLGTFDFGGKTFSCNPHSRDQILSENGYVALFGMFDPGWEGAWKAEDNSYLTIATVDVWKSFYSAMVAQGQANFNHAQSLKSTLAGATTPEQVAAIVW